MQTFRILYFRESVLDHSEEVFARDVVEAVEQVTGTPPQLSAEIWSEQGKVGIVRAALNVS